MQPHNLLIVTAATLTLATGCRIETGGGEPGAPSPGGGQQERAVTTPSDNSEIDAVVEQDGVRYELRRGGVYEVKPGGERVLIRRIYDADFHEKNYEVENGVTYRVDEAANVRLPVLRNFRESFENAPDIQSLIGPGRGWSGFTLQSPRAPEVRDYNTLRQRIMRRQSGFLDNIVEPSTERARTGAASLRLVAAPPTRRMTVTKSSLDTGLVYFRKGDHFWYSGWYYLEEGRPLGVMDLESSFIEDGPGMRVLFSEDGRPRMELKWADKPTYRAANPAYLRTGAWTNIKVHLYLSEREDGVIQLWVGETLAVNARGQTLPVKDAVYDRLQVGITANPPGSRSVVYLDDIEVSTDPL